MLLKQCAKCSKLIPYGRRYCDDCKIIAESEEQDRKKKRNKRYNQSRDSKYIKFYKSEDWKILSRKRLQADKYKCRMCGKLAEETDHIIPIQTEEGWNKRLDFSNTQALCVKCHNKKHNRFQSR